MPVMARLDPRDTSRGFAPWRVAIWLLLLLAGFGCVQYLIHAQLLWAQRAHVSGPDAGTLNRLLAWDAGYFVVAFVLIVLCAGCILRQAWARAPMRVACVVLALWALATGGMLAAQWLAFERSSADALLQLASGDRLRTAIVHARRSYRIALGFKLATAPVLLWLAWQLGAPSARAQFRQRRR